MSKSEQTKEKLLALMDILRRDTDEDHHLLVKDIIERLNQRGIAAERKSLYRDISILEEAGWDIMHDRKGYYLASDTFELAELKLLVDAIQCSRFITEKKSYELIEKLESLTSQYRANQLRRGGSPWRVKRRVATLSYSPDCRASSISGRREGGSWRSASITAT